MPFFRKGWVVEGSVVIFWGPPLAKSTFSRTFVSLVSTEGRIKISEFKNLKHRCKRALTLSVPVAGTINM